MCNKTGIHCTCRHPQQPFQCGPFMLVLILPTPEGWKAERTLAGKKTVTQIFNPQPGRGLNQKPLAQDWEAEILPLHQPLDCCYCKLLITSVLLGFHGKNLRNCVALTKNCVALHGIMSLQLKWLSSSVFTPFWLS